MLKLFKMPETNDHKRDFYARCIAFVIIAIGFFMSVKNLFAGLSDIANTASTETAIESVYDVDAQEEK